MMLVCVEAGQSLDQAIIRVAREIRASFPALADEFEIVALEMKAGKDKATVFNDLAERCGVQDVSKSPPFWCSRRLSARRFPTRCASLPARCATSA